MPRALHVIRDAQRPEPLVRGLQVAPDPFTVTLSMSQDRQLEVHARHLEARLHVGEDLERTPKKALGLAEVTGGCRRPRQRAASAAHTESVPDGRRDVQRPAGPCPRLLDLSGREEGLGEEPGEPTFDLAQAELADAQHGPLE